MVLMTMTMAGAAWAGEDKPEPQVRLELDLVDASYISGVPGIESVPVQTPYAKMDIPLKQILTLTIGEDHETAAVEMRNGDKLKGVVNIEPIKLETAFGKVTIGVEHIRKLDVVLSGGAPSEIAGMAMDQPVRAALLKPLPSRGQPGAACSVLSLGVHDGRLYCGTYADLIGSYDGTVYRYDGGTSWTYVGDPAPHNGGFNEGRIYSFASYDGNLYAGWSLGHSSMTQFGGVKRYAGGTAWVDSLKLSDFGNDNGCGALAVYRGKLYAATGHTKGKLFAFDGTAWSDRGGPPPAATVLRSLAVYDDKLYGIADPIGLYYYDENRFVVVGYPPGMTGLHPGLGVHERRLLIGAFNDKTNTIQSYDGRSWRDLKAPPAVANGVNAFASHGRDLYVAAATKPGTLYRWSRRAWEPVGSGGLHLNALKAHEGTLFVASSDMTIGAHKALVYGLEEAEK